MVQCLRWSVLVVLLIGVLCCLLNVEGQKLESYNVDPNSITVSGVSSGAAFAIQMQVAHSSVIKGLGFIAGPPYWCAGGNINVATTSCTVNPTLISIPHLVSATHYAYNTGTIDNPANIQKAKVWVGFGTKDSVVVPGVTLKAYEYYTQFGANLTLKEFYGAQHAWISSSYGNKCDFLGPYFINNCNFDASGALLQFVYPSSTLAPKKTPVSKNFIRFGQGSYVPFGWFLSNTYLNEYGYIYVPDSCTSGARCKLHVFFHGCLQSANNIGDHLYTNSGLADWAESNNIIILYPQLTTNSFSLVNPKGCWDFWGYTGQHYATRSAPQINSVRNMIKALCPQCSI